MKETTINWLLFLISFVIVFGYLYIHLTSKIEPDIIEVTREIYVEVPVLDVVATTIQQTQEQLDFEQREIFCLAKNMYFEARGEPLMGRLAVAFVTINRVNSSRYPRTVCGVVHQGAHDTAGRPLLHRCQFSWYCDGLPDVIEDREIYSKILGEARHIYTKYYIENELLDLVEGATHYHADYVNPYWTTSYSMTSTIGAHIFYRPD